MSINIKIPITQTIRVVALGSIPNNTVVQLVPCNSIGEELPLSEVPQLNMNYIAGIVCVIEEVDRDRYFVLRNMGVDDTLCEFDPSTPVIPLKWKNRDCSIFEFELDLSSKSEKNE